MHVNCFFTFECFKSLSLYIFVKCRRGYILQFVEYNKRKVVSISSEAVRLVSTLIDGLLQGKSATFSTAARLTQLSYSHVNSDNAVRSRDLIVVNASKFRYFIL